MKIHLWPVATLLSLILSSFSAKATPIISEISVIIDKPAYSWAYSVGVTAYIDSQQAPVASVQVSHLNLQSDSAGEWPLSTVSNQNSWWSWSNSYPRQSAGPLDGTLEVTAIDSNGESTTVNAFQFKPEEELALPSFSVERTNLGYRVVTEDVTGADFYNLWVWDPATQSYPSSQTATTTSEFQVIPFSELSAGKTYEFFVIANNRFSGGMLDSGDRSLFRSYDEMNVTYESASIPEPSSIMLFLTGLASFGTLARRRRSC